MDDFHTYLQKSWFYLTHLYSRPAFQWDSLAWILVCAALFIPLALVFPGKRTQPYFRRDMFSDGIYWFLGPKVYSPIFIYFATFFFSFKFLQFPALATLPILLQAVLILLITDFLQYWMHRLFHKDLLWRFHAVHHSTTNLDWLSAARFHPVNIILYSTMMNALVYTLGFSVEAFLILQPFNAIYSPLVHANLTWNYGPFKYVLASPVFHRWHHTGIDEGGNKNFAPTFPFIDLMFGTFYMPEGVQPSNFGAHHDTITGNILQQLVYPFMSEKTPAEPQPQPATAQADGKA